VHSVQNVEIAVDLVQQAILSTYHQNSQLSWPNSALGRNTENVRGVFKSNRDFNYTGIKRDASVAVLHTSGKCVLITDRRRTCRGPVQRPLIKMADNSVLL
jgi:hypothetical protein